MLTFIATDKPESKLHVLNSFTQLESTIAHISWVPFATDTWDNLDSPKYIETADLAGLVSKSPCALSTFKGYAVVFLKKK